ncbi:hypothetical protein BZA70DRAFT_279177 [Myxozyma melibiosi]|uniref:Uncharacterized protein n=1 Tax=Myxozyma melibiosi TaxID=54550 RepID=A0ABR1F5M4_9ASCO
MASTSAARGRQPVSLAQAAHAAEQQLARRRMRRSSISDSDSSDSSFSSDEASIYEAEVFVDIDPADALSYIDHLPDKDEASKLYPAVTNGSYVAQTPAEDTTNDAASTRSHRPLSLYGGFASSIVVAANHHDPTLQSSANSNNNNTTTTTTINSTAAVGGAIGHGHGGIPRSNRNSIVFGSQSSNGAFRSIDYSEYTYDLGWTAASRIHSRTSSVFQMPPPQTNPGQTFVGSPGFASPGFLATRGALGGDGASIVSHIDNIDAQSALYEEANAAVGDAVVDAGEEVASASTSQPVDIAGAAAAESNAVEHPGDAYSAAHLDDIASSPPVSFVNITCSADGVCNYPDTDLATLIDYASPRVPPFPSTAEAEELLYSRMSAQSRAALHKLMHGRNPSVPRPPRFRPPISQNMGYGAISRHPFYHSSRSSSNARSIDSQNGLLSRQPSRAPEPSYTRRIFRDATNSGEFGGEDIGFWESFRSFVVAECCFCFIGETEPEQR